MSEWVSEASLKRQIKDAFDEISQGKPRGDFAALEVKRGRLMTGSFRSTCPGRRLLSALFSVQDPLKLSGSLGPRLTSACVRVRNLPSTFR